MISRVIARVVLDKTVLSYDKPYDYAVPDSMVNLCRPGCRVIVPFGRSDTERQGMVLSIGNITDDSKLKNVICVADSEPVLSAEMLSMCSWFHDTLFCTYYDAINALLPTGISLMMRDTFSAVADYDIGSLSTSEAEIYSFLLLQKSGVALDRLTSRFNLTDAVTLDKMVKKGALLKNIDAVQKVGDATQKTLTALVDSDKLSSYLLTERQREIAQLVIDSGAVSVREIQYFTGVSMSVINTLVKRGIINCFDKEVYRLPNYKADSSENKNIVLTDEQEQAFNSLSTKLSTGTSALLYGITGSGKTQVFLKLVDRVVNEGRGVIIMVPEISLTPQTISIFNNRYHGKIAVFHSAMSLGKRMDEWKRIRAGDALIAIGTRSAIFAPFDDIGLIIMDEEHEHTYKSESSPRFHARDVARFRTAYHKGLFVMASATPSVETYSAALAGKYMLCTLKKRFGGAVLPHVQTVDMRQEINNGNTGLLSQALVGEIDKAVSSGNQAIVLLNRRGHNTYVSCPSCGYVASCPNCSVSLTYHSANKRLMCHYCGYSQQTVRNCPECNNDHMRFSGAGTQKVEEELRMIFPKARILRLDADSTAARNSFSNYLSEFAEGKYDIMLGTQMVAKGLDFPNVTVVGVLSAEGSANDSDFRSAERTFSLLTQVIGRAGRGQTPGTAIIQTSQPENNIINLAHSQDYGAFYEDEIKLRRLLTYPPFCDIISVLVQSSSKEDAEGTAAEIFAKIKSKVETEYGDVKLIVLGPVAATLPRLNNKYRYSLIIKCRNNERTRRLIRESVDVRMKRDSIVSVDINPERVN